MTSRTRVTVSLSEDVVRHARHAAGGNLSGYVEKALRDKALADAGRALAEWERTPLSDQELVELAEDL